MNKNINNNIFNQLDKSKDISNVYINKKYINFNYTEKSYRIKFGAYYISVPKKFCHLDKTNYHYLIGIKRYYTYNIYDAQVNFTEKLSGVRMMNKYKLIFHHFQTVYNRRFEKEKKRDSSFSKFKNVEESMKLHKQEQKEIEKNLEYTLKNMGIDPDDLIFSVPESNVSEFYNNKNQTPNHKFDDDYFSKKMKILWDNSVIDDLEDDDSDQ